MRAVPHPITSTIARRLTILLVVLAACGGGDSSAPIQPSNNPTPVVVSAAPAQLTAGASAATVTITGSQFVATSRVKWNDAERTTTYVDGATLKVDLTAADLANPATGVLTVVNPAPGGGTSGQLNVTVAFPVPTITSLAPAPATALSAFTLTVTGTGFYPTSVVRWNGADRPTTFVSSTSLTAAIPASDVTAPANASIVVVNPTPGGGVSAAKSLAVQAPPIAITGTLTIPNNALVRDSIRNVLYASINANGGANANAVVKIDPATRTIISSLPVGPSPGAMAMSEDGQFLYVGLLGASKIVRVDLQTFSKDIEFGLPASSMSGNPPLYGGDLLVLPGLPRSVVVSLQNNCCSPAYEGVAIYDDSVPRTDRTDMLGASRIVRGPTTSAIYGFNDQGYSYFHRMFVTPTGIKEDSSSATQGLLQSYTDIEYDGGLVFGTDGAVIDPVAMSLLGRIPVSGNAVRGDVANGRVHILDGFGGNLHTYSLTNYSTRIGIFQDATLAGHKTLVRWGADGLAAGGGSTIVFLRGTLVAP
jgi:IPT/TIG domain